VIYASKGSSELVAMRVVNARHARLRGVVALFSIDIQIIVEVYYLYGVSMIIEKEKISQLNNHMHICRLYMYLYSKYICIHVFICLPMNFFSQARALIGNSNICATINVPIYMLISLNGNRTTRVVVGVNIWLRKIDIEKHKGKPTVIKQPSQHR
ncbi:hypothetical protein ACJX0J_040267, partial [Zea mays]